VNVAANYDKKTNSYQKSVHSELPSDLTTFVEAFLSIIAAHEPSTTFSYLSDHYNIC